MEIAAGKAGRRRYGSGSLFERADRAGRVSWYGQWRRAGVQVKRRIGAKRLAGSSAGLTRAQAERALREQMRELESPSGTSRPATIAQLGRAYLLDLERRGARRSTRAAVEAALRTHLEPFFGERAIEAITAAEVAELARLMKGKGLSAKSVRNYISTLSALYRFARDPRRGWAASNPCDGLRLERPASNGKIRVLEPEQVQALAAHAAPGAFQAIDAALFRTAAMTGLRLGELCALRWRDVDWSSRAIHVRESYVMGEFAAPQGGHISRNVPLADPLAAALERYREARGQPDEGELLFSDPRPRAAGRPLEKTAVLHRMRRALSAAGLDVRYRFHDLRHTFGIAMARAGVPIATLQRWMGHREIQTTQRYAEHAPRSSDAVLAAGAFAELDDAVHDRDALRGLRALYEGGRAARSG